MCAHGGLLLDGGTRGLLVELYTDGENGGPPHSQCGPPRPGVSDIARKPQDNKQAQSVRSSIFLNYRSNPDLIVCANGFWHVRCNPVIRGLSPHYGGDPLDELTMRIEAPLKRLFVERALAFAE